MSNTARGLWPLLGYAALTAAVDVYAGNRLQSLSPISVAAISFSLAAAFFLALETASKGAGSVLRLLRAQRHDVIAINLTTAATWLTLLYALKNLEPAIVNVVALAIGPALTMLLSPLLRRGSEVLVVERVISVGVLIVIAVLMWWSAVGLTGMRVQGDQVTLGLVLTLLCGLACTGNVIYSKRLSDSGMTPQASLAVRYFLMLAICWSLVAFSDSPRLGSSFVPGAVIAVIGVALPMYFGQVGIKHVEPITASLLETLSPVCAFGLQLLDGRLRPSGYSLAGILAITVLVAVGVVARSRYERGQLVSAPPAQAVPTLSDGAI